MLKRLSMLLQDWGHNPDGSDAYNVRPEGIGAESVQTTERRIDINLIIVGVMP